MIGRQRQLRNKRPFSEEDATRLVQGDLSNDLWGRIRGYCFGVACLVRQDEDLADEVAGELILKLMINRDKVDPSRDLALYLNSLIANEIYDLTYRKDHEKRRAFQFDDSESLIPDETSFDPYVSVANERSLGNLMAHARNGLAPAEGDRLWAFFRHHIDGRTYEQIAQDEGFREERMKYMLNKTKTKLAEQFPEESYALEVA